jgi:hypothetical protein
MATLFAVYAAFAGGAEGAKTPQRNLVDRDDQQHPRQRTENVTGLDNATSLTWVAVDTMGNAFGPASRGVKPMAYDSATAALAVLHRGAVTYAASTGQLWYNISRTGGSTWYRVPSAVSTGVENLLRYPSCAIANPTNSNDTSDVIFLWAAPLLDPAGAAFGRMAWGLDFPIGSGNGSGTQSSGDQFWSNSHIWGSRGTTDVIWATYRYITTTGLPADLWRFHTSDFINITENVPPIWAASNFETSFGLDITGCERNGKQYMGKWGPFTGDPNWQIVDNVGYSVSTDGGVTWGAWTRPQPDWRSAVGLPSAIDWWTYGGPGAYSKDMLVDANNRVHFFGVVFDTNNANQRSVVEVYETGTGWGGKVITNALKASTLLNYPGTAGDLNQMGNHLNAAITTTGDVMALVWLDGGNPGETYTDIWFSWRRITDANWSTPLNLTQTPTFAELLLQAAPTLRKDPNGWTIFLGRCYESGVTTYPPESGNPTVFYSSSYSWTPTGIDERQMVPASFSLKQNYPNPFNPSTSLAYSIPTRANVRLSVYDVLGREVATLVNETKEAGEYDATFLAEGLSSGVYFYTLRAGAFMETRRMVLMK